MGYVEAIEAAGVPVLAFQQFGTYQGDWLAKVAGGYIHGCYGSCSYCDAFDSEFGFYSDEGCERHKYSDEDDPSCIDCIEAYQEYNERLRAFGRRYLDDIQTADEVRADFIRDIDWDTDASRALKWIDKQEAEGNE